MRVGLRFQGAPKTAATEIAVTGVGIERSSFRMVGLNKKGARTGRAVGPIAGSNLRRCLGTS